MQKIISYEYKTYLVWSSWIECERFWQYCTISENKRAYKANEISPFPLLKGLSIKDVLDRLDDIII